MRELAAIMFVDIAGFTALMGKDERSALNLIHVSKDIQKPLVRRYHGLWLKELGDGVMCKFPTASDAVGCALEIQSAAISRGDLNLKIGIHLGEITEEDGDIYGDGVNVASRIESIGKSKSILISKKIRDEIKNQDQFTMTSLGQFDFVNVDEPVEIFALTNKGLYVPKRHELSGKLKNKRKVPLSVLLIISVLIILFSLIKFLPGKFDSEKTSSIVAKVENSIAVLPFENLNNDATLDYYSQGVSDEIRSQLASLQSLKVISRASSIFFKDKVPSMDEIRKTLKVNYILGGRMWINKESFRLRVFLTNTNTDREIWSSSAMEGPLGDVIKIQEDIAMQVADQLGVSSYGKVSRFGPIDKVEAPIYNLWLKAWSDHEKYSQKDFESAFQIGGEILKRDSAFSLGYFLLGDYYLMNAVWFGGIDSGEGRTKSIYNFKKGLELDPNNALCLVGLGNAVLFFEHNSQYAIELFERAKKLGEPRANLALSMVNIYNGNFSVAEEHLIKFSELDPLSVFKNFFLGRILFFQNKTEESIRVLKEGIDKYGLADSYHSLGKVYLNTNRYEDAIEILTRGIKETGQDMPAMLGDLAIAYYRVGKKVQCDEIIKDLKLRFQNAAVGSPAFYVGQIYCGIDEPATALDWLEKSFKAGETEMIWLKIEPQFKKLSNQNRYIKLLDQLGFL